MDRYKRPIKDMGTNTPSKQRLSRLKVVYHKLSTKNSECFGKISTLQRHMVLHQFSFLHCLL